MKIKKLKFDAQIRDTQVEVIEQYAERMLAGDKFPPVDVFHDGKAHYLGDGFHRVHAAGENGQQDIEACVHRGTLSDAKWYAMGANRTNGAHMRRKDIRLAIEIALEEFPELTQQRIANQIGCSQQYVGQVQKQVTSNSKLHIPVTRVGKDGKQYPTTHKTRSPESDGQGGGRTNIRTPEKSDQQPDVREPLKTNLSQAHVDLPENGGVLRGMLDTKVNPRPGSHLFLIQEDALHGGYYGAVHFFLGDDPQDATVDFTMRPLSRETFEEGLVLKRWAYTNWFSVDDIEWYPEDRTVPRNFVWNQYIEPMLPENMSHLRRGGNDE